MSRELPLSLQWDGESDYFFDGPDTSHEHEETNEGYDTLYTKCLRRKKPRVDFTVSSEINKKLLKKNPLKYEKSTSKRPSVELASVTASGSGLIGMIDTFDRPAYAKAEGTYAQAKKYSDAIENKPGKRIPKAGAFAEAGVGRASAEYSVFEAEAKGPNASAGVEASLSTFGAGAMARAELASVSATAGPFSAKLGLGFDTGVSIGAGGLEAKILGIGISIGPKTSISLLGSEVSCSVM